MQRAEQPCRARRHDLEGDTAIRRKGGRHGDRKHLIGARGARGTHGHLRDEHRGTAEAEPEQRDRPRDAHGVVTVSVKTSPAE